MGSLETQRIYGVDSLQGRVFEEFPAPGRPIGACVMGDELRVVCSENGKEDNRFIRRYIEGHGFKEKEKIPCPDDTGSFVAFDGDLLYLSQRFNKRILDIDERGQIIRVVAELPLEITGMTIFGGCFYLAISGGVDSGDFRITKVDARKADARDHAISQASRSKRVRSVTTASASGRISAGRSNSSRLNFPSKLFCRARLCAGGG